MARRQKKDDDDAEAQSPGLIRSFFRFLNTTFVLVVILYCAARAMIFTAGFRDLVQEQILARYDLPVTIGKIRSNWRCDLSLENVALTNVDNTSAAPLHADRVDLDWSPVESVSRGHLALRRIEITGCSITFTARGGMWEPASLAPLTAKLAKWLDVDLPVSTNADVASLPNATNHATLASSSRLSDTAFAIRDLSLAWRGETGELARVTGLSLNLSQVHVPGRDFKHYRLKLDEARARDGTTLKDVDLELIDTGDQQIVLGFKAERHKAAP